MAPQWLKAALVLAFALLSIPSTIGQEPFYPLIVNGSANLEISYGDDNVLVVHFRRSARAAGPPSAWIQNLPPGTAAWVDRPLNDREPLMLHQQMNDEQAKAAIERLKQRGGYWKFYCRNIGTDYFEVSQSEPAYATTSVDRD